MITPAPPFMTDRSGDSDRARTPPQEPWRHPDRDHFERGVNLPGFEPTWAPPEEDDDPAPPTRTDEHAEPGF